MTQVIAVRRLSWEGEQNREVLVAIGKPAEAANGVGEFYCPSSLAPGLSDQAKPANERPGR